MATNARALHYVFRIANRKAAIDFYTNVLQMKVLRHEEFEKPCEAQCNGPYDGMWSKTMVGYGAEDEHFVLELTYNYDVKGGYQNGNDFRGIYIASDSVLASVKASHSGRGDASKSCLTVTDPDGHKFFVRGGNNNTHPITAVAINVSDLGKSKDFWTSLCGMSETAKERENGGEEEAKSNHCWLTFGENQCKLGLFELAPGETLDRGTAFGRIAFSAPTDQLSKIEARMRADSGDRYILTPLKSLDTPGKATVWVVILQDPNAHEICFVGDEAFRELSAVDPAAGELLSKAIAKDDSDQFYK